MPPTSLALRNHLDLDRFTVFISVQTFLKSLLVPSRGFCITPPFSFYTLWYRATQGPGLKWVVSGMGNVEKKNGHMDRVSLPAHTSLTGYPYSSTYILCGNLSSDLKGYSSTSYRSLHSASPPPLNFISSACLVSTPACFRPVVFQPPGSQKIFKARWRSAVTSNRGIVGKYTDK